MAHPHGLGRSSVTPRRHTTGFTLMEVMLAVTIASILVGVAIPSFRQFILNSRLTGAANDLTIAFTTARAQAIKTHVQTIVCLSADPTAATPACDGNGTQGWVVFSDTSGNGTPDVGEPVTLRHTAIPNSVKVRTIPAVNAGFVAYSPSGFSKQIAAVGVDLTNIILCDSRGNTAEYGANNSTARVIQISTTGRSRVSRVVTEIADAGECP